MSQKQGDFIVWGKEILQFRLIGAFLPRFTDSYFALKFSHDALDQNKEKIAAFLSGGTPDLISKVVNLEKITEEQLEEMQSAVEDATTKRVEDYLSTLRNLSVVLLCSSLEITLNEVVNVVLQKEPRILMGVASEKSLTLKEIVEAGDYEGVLSQVREKQVERFSWKEIGEKMGFLEKHLGVKTDAILDWGGFKDEIQKLLKDCDLLELKRIFEKRHSIVHDGKRPFEDDSEIEQILEFFQKLTWNLCISLSEKFKIPIDAFGFYPTWMQGESSGKQAKLVPADHGIAEEPQ